MRGRPRELSARVSALLQHPHHAPASVHLDRLAGPDRRRRATDVDHRRNAVLPRDDAAVAEQAPGVHDDACGRNEVRGPPRVGERRDEDLAGPHVVVLGRAQDHAGMWGARRLGFGVARGAWIVVFDSDGRFVRASDLQIEHPQFQKENQKTPGS